MCCLQTGTLSPLSDCTARVLNKTIKTKSMTDELYIGSSYAAFLGAAPAEGLDEEEGPCHSCLLYR